MIRLGYSPYALLPLLALTLSLVLATKAWRFRSEWIGKTFVTLMLALAWWSLCVVMEHLSLDLGAKFFWVQMSYFGVAAIPVGWLVFTVKYTERSRWLTGRVMLALTALPLLTVGIVWTNSLHHLMWKQVWLDTSVSPPTDAVTHGLWFWVNAAYSYLLLFAGTFLLAVQFRSSSGMYRRQTGTLLIAAMVPWAANALFIAGVKPFNAVDPTPLAFSLTGIAFYWGLAKLHLLDVLPIAHEAVLKSMADGVVVLDNRQRVVDLNPAAQGIIGTKRSDVIGQPYKAVLPGQASLLDIAPDLQEAKGVVAIGQGQDQRYYEVGISPILTNERVHGHLILLHDDTERVQAEVSSRQRMVLETELNERKRAAQEIQRRLEFEQALACISSRFVGLVDVEPAIEDTLRDLGVLCGARRSYLFMVNEDGLSLEKRHEWLACAPGTYGPGQCSVLDSGLEWWISALAKGEAIRFPAAAGVPAAPPSEIQPLLPPGTRSILVFPLRGTKASGFVGIDDSEESHVWTENDVTILRMTAEILGSALDRKAAADQLVRLNAELNSLNSQLEAKVEERTRELENAVSVDKASDQAKSEFLASMSHELRTPLNSIIGFSQVLQEQYFGTLNEKQAEYVSDVVGSGKHLLSLINDILDLSKVEAGKLELDITKVKIADLVRSSLVMIKEKALAHGIGLEVEIPEELESLEIAADERRVKQVMFNLLSNSAKFTPDGGTITVTVRQAGIDCIETSVADTGIGMTQEEQKRLFEAFYQASGGIKDKTPGTGLGLAITKRIVEKHGGKIWMHSDGPNKGSCFTFSLPTKDAVSEPQTVLSMDDPRL